MRVACSECPAICHRIVRRWRTRQRRALAGLIALCWLAGLHLQANARTCAPETTEGLSGAAAELRLDNDLLGGQRQDRGYTSGTQLMLSFARTEDRMPADCAPQWADRLASSLDWLHAEGFERQRWIVGFGHSMFTPAQRNRTDLLVDDRPYAAVLLLSVGHSERDAQQQRLSILRFGILGPSARGEQIQNGWHRLIDNPPWRGWDNQLHDEPVLQLLHERTRRWPGDPVGNLRWDLIGHWRASLGNLATYASTGLELRIGQHLPDDFGIQPVRSVGEGATLRDPHGSPHWAWHAFAGVDARATARNITLDGNTWRDSHSVVRRVFVADVVTGVALAHGPWKLAFARHLRTREFDGQQLLPVYGSITISRAL